MSEQPESLQAPVEPQPKAQSPLLRPVVMTAIVILLLMVTAWGGNMRANQAKIAEIERSVNALSEAIEPSALANDPSKLDRTLLSIAEAGNYKSVSYTDSSGMVISTTDSVRRGKRYDNLANCPAKAKASTENGLIVVRRAVILAGDTRLGNIEVILN